MSMSAADMQALQSMYDSAGALEAKKISQTYKLGKDDIKARLKIAAQSSKDTRYGIDAERDTAREQIEQARQEMERIGIPDMEIRRFVAEANKAIAEEELALKRDIFLVDTRQKDAQLQLDREQMERVGIPQMEIDRYIAEKSAEMDRLTFGEGQRQFDTTFSEGQRQFNVGASGYITTPGTLTLQQQARYDQLQDLQARTAAQGGLAAIWGQGSADELQALEDIRTGVAAGPGGGGPQATLEREQFQQTQLEQARRYGLDVSKFGAELASTPDTYFQARRFQGVDVPRLMGGPGAATTTPYGGPTPQIATMGAYLSGQDPAAVGRTPGSPGPEVPGVLGMPGTPEDDRQKQLAAIAKASPPSPYDGLTDQDAATLKLMQSVYSKGGQSIAGGEYERLAASGRLGYLQSAGKILGFDPKELESQYQAYRPTQGSARLA